MKQDMKHLLYLTLCITATWCVACQETPATDSMQSNVHPRFVLNSSVQTRVTYPSIYESTFEDGDILGAFALIANGQQDSEGHALYDLATGTTPNAQYKVRAESDGTLSLEPVIGRDVFPAGNEYTYVFYYPYKEGVSLSDEGKILITHSVEADQTTPGRYERSDLLWDVTRLRESSPAEAPVVDVEMDHLMTHLVFRIEADDPLGSDFGEVTGVKVCDVKATVTDINLSLPMTSDGHGLEGSHESVDETDVQMWEYSNSYPDAADSGWKTFRVAIPAATIANGNNRNFFTVTNASGASKSWTASFAGGSATFLPGRYYLFTVEDGDLRFRGLIEDLEDGGDHYYEYD